MYNIETYRNLKPHLNNDKIKKIYTQKQIVDLFPAHLLTDFKVPYAKTFSRIPTFSLKYSFYCKTFRNTKGV